MKDPKQLKEMVESIIHLHECRDFDALSSYISESELQEGSWFTNNRFFEVCEAMENEIGSIASLEYISALKRKTSYLTLWKAGYSKTSDEVLWQITFDSMSNKIQLMYINWEKV